jgi:hypothetical protein
MVLPVEFVDATNDGEIMVPGDNPNVFTIGDNDPTSSKGPTMTGRQKPDVLLASAEVTYSEGLQTATTSNAAAYFAGILAVLKAEEPRFQREHLTRYISQLAAQAATAAKQQPGAGQPGDEQKVGFDFVTKYFDPIVRSVYQLSGHQPMGAFRRQSDGRVILTVAHITNEMEPLFHLDQSSVQWTSLYPQATWNNLVQHPEDFEIYLVTRCLAQPTPMTRGVYRVYGYIRPRFLADGSRAAYPWYVFKEDRAYYTELRLTGAMVASQQQSQTTGWTTTPPPLWKTPTPEQLHNLVRE